MFSAPRLILPVRLLAVAMIACVVFLLPHAAWAQAPSTAFVYQGQLTSDGQLVTASCNFSFALFGTATGGAQIGATITRNNVAVTNGLFAAALDFGGAPFSGAPRFLEIAVQCPGDAALVTLLPRQQLSPTPYAIFATNALSAQTAQSAQSAVNAQTAVNAQNAASAASVAWNNVTGKPAWALPDLPAWQKLGNAATAGEFVGTTNNLALELRTNNLPALRLVPGQDTNSDGDSIAAPHVLAGESTNQVDATKEGSAIGGGSQNTLAESYGVIGGGMQNAATFFGVVGGGSENTISGSSYGVIGGGLQNAILESTTSAHNANTIGGGSGNQTNGRAVTVAGGETNHATGNWSTIGGGNSNTITGGFSTIAGGANNAVSANFATVSGIGNVASAEYTTIPGGQEARANLYGQLAYSSGNFAQPGDAQVSLYLLRGSTNNSTSTLALDGASALLTIPNGRATAIDVMVVGKATGAISTAAYSYQGVLRYSGGITPVLQMFPPPSASAPEMTPLFEDVAGWSARIFPFFGVLVIEVVTTGTGTVEWVASVRATEVGP